VACAERDQAETVHGDWTATTPRLNQRQDAKTDRRSVERQDGALSPGATANASRVVAASRMATSSTVEPDGDAHVAFARPSRSALANEARALRPGRTVLA
jgi:hypothetical protein